MRSRFKFQVIFSYMLTCCWWVGAGRYPWNYGNEILHRVVLDLLIAFKVDVVKKLVLYGK